MKIIIKLIQGFKIFFIGLPIFFINYKLLKGKKYIVYLFSSRFGHFLQNTEIFLRSIKSTDKYLLVTENKVDNTDISNVWGRYVTIFPKSVGDFMRVFFKIKIIHLRSYTVPQNKKYLENRVIKKIDLSPDNKKLRKIINKDFISITCRDSQYNKIFYKDFRDPHRDTNINEFKKTINFFRKKNFNFVKVNKSFKKLNVKNLVDYGYSDNYNLDTAFSLIKESNFHVGSSTGLDSYPAFIDKQLVIFNVCFGSDFMTRLHTVPSMFIPINTFFKENKKIVPLKKQLEILKACEKKFKISTPTKNEMDYFGIYQETNSYDEMKNAIKEYQVLIKNSLKLDSNLRNIQKLFWSNYPETWYKHEESKKIYFVNKNFKGNFLISKYYVDKYEGFLEKNFVNK